MSALFAAAAALGGPPSFLLSCAHFHCLSCFRSWIVGAPVLYSLEWNRVPTQLVVDTTDVFILACGWVVYYVVFIRFLLFSGCNQWGINVTISGSTFNGQLAIDVALDVRVIKELSNGERNSGKPCLPVEHGNY